MPDNPRNLNVLFYQPVVDAIDEFRFQYRIESRTDAIRRLIEFGLKHPKEAAKDATVGRKPVQRAR